MIRRVLMTTDTVGGVWNYSLELARFFAEQNIEVGLATMGRALSASQWTDARSIPGMSIFESHYKLEWMENPWSDLQQAGQWLLNLEGSFRPDVVHLNALSFGDLPWNRPCLTVFHSCVCSWWEGVKHEPPPHEWDCYRRRVGSGLRGAAMVVAPTQAILNVAERLYGPLKQACVIPNGRSQREFEPSIKEPFVLSVGRLWDEAKNLGALSDASSSVSWPILVAGESDGRTALPGINSLGPLSGEEVSEWMSRASIYALPARYEPFGLSVLEAALSGCALVLGDIKSLRENWDGCALFVDPNKPKELSQAIQSLIDAPDLRSLLSNAAMERAKRFDSKRFGEAYLQAYRALTSHEFEFGSRRSPAQVSYL